MKITEHFDSDEFACHDGTPYPLDTVEDGTGIPTGYWAILCPQQSLPVRQFTWGESRLTPLCQTLEAIRAELQKVTPTAPAAAQPAPQVLPLTPSPAPYFAANPSANSGPVLAAIRQPERTPT
jgi:hypothetical protein